MALRAMYKGFKKVLAPLIINRPGVLAIDQDALNTELNSVFFPRLEQTVLGAKNLFDNKMSDTSLNGLVFTVNSDKTITVTGTATGHTSIRSDITLSAGSYIGNGCPAGGSSTKYRMNFQEMSGSVSHFDSGEGVSFTLNSETTMRVWIDVEPGAGTDINLTFKPMIRLANDPDPTYVPYAMTNKQLTDEVGAIENSIAVKTYTNMSIAEICAAIKGNSARGMKGFAFGTVTGLPTLTTGFGIAIWDNSFSSGYVQVIASYQNTTESAYVQLPAGREISEINREAAPEDVTPEEEPEVKKTTRKKSTAKADTEKEGE